jgi:hypothetical protein
MVAALQIVFFLHSEVDVHESSVFVAKSGLHLPAFAIPFFVVDDKLVENNPTIDKSISNW